ncbi:MAG: carbon storage regulator [Fusobacteriaceae bacterium]|jgi:carbon storage regulator|uniref:Translational regulator CsrA n=1 Tax=Hypnocyclicus thermotrophus TaxID=1627895 RepID=A0AA46I505_9FUSO|nr:carbon storage regulator CsrA [Hypnocyclicus thermotrophus]MBZ4683468.1 csrA [Fusobacteriales bacterium]MDN5304243.1 carbon storage regulator [Fusobacteriaceae bacterium]TDT68071.1 carbon storage regulator CsrA [Hypnocyclicus thermotrophus]
MLVLSRKKNESIIIGDDIEVIVVDIKGDQVKLGIKAPRSVSVHRAEVYEEIQAENRKAAETPKEISGLSGLFNKFKKK